MAVYAPRPEIGFTQPRMIACPAEWARFEEAERDFLDAENERLLYVAATRSGTCLVVSGRDKRPGENPWRPLAEDLAAAGLHQDPGPQPAPSRLQISVSLADVEEGANGINERWSGVRKATYRVEAVKAAALASASSRSDSQFRSAASGEKPVDVELAEGATQAERGVEWGEDIHVLLEAAMRRPDADLESLARSLTREREHAVDEDQRAKDLLNCVQTVRNSADLEAALVRASNARAG